MKLYEMVVRNGQLNLGFGVTVKSVLGYLVFVSGEAS
jgi:hypothetical protein